MTRRLAKFIKKLLRICDHEYSFVELVHEQNLRGGYAHWSQIYRCNHCGKFETRELGL